MSVVLPTVSHKVCHGYDSLPSSYNIVTNDNQLIRVAGGYTYSLPFSRPS